MHKLDFTRMFVWSDLAAHEILQILFQLVGWRAGFMQDDESLRHHSIKVIRRADYRYFGNSSVFQQHPFDFRRADIDAPTNNEVIIAALILEESVAIANVNVARYVPAFAHVSLLWISEPQIPATGR